MERNIRKIGKELFITNDEEIKEGDWFIYRNYRLCKCTGLSQSKQILADNEIAKHKDYGKPQGLSKKIILTTDQDLIKNGIQSIDDEFLDWFIMNPNCEKVEVGKENICARCHCNDINDCWSAKECSDGKFDTIKYKIIIPKEEPKQRELFLMNATTVIDTRKPKQTVHEYEQKGLEKYSHELETKQEIWKDIPNYEGMYQVSNLGNVKSLKRYVKGKIENRLQKENILSKRLVGDIRNQYYAVTLCNNKDRKQIKVSVLVAMAFLNHTSNGYAGFTVDHIDNNPLNNNLTNLQVITKRENSSKDRKGISKYTGVTFNKKTNKWRSQIWINGKNKTLGSFDDELEAHRAYQKELQQHLKS